MERESGVLFSFEGFLVFSNESYRKYRKLLEPFGEFLSAKFKSEDVQLYNCTNLLQGAIDEDNTINELGHICGPVIDFRNVSFDPAVVSSSMLSRNTGIPTGRLWFSTVGDDTSLLQFFLDNQTGFRPEPVFTTKI